MNEPNEPQEGIRAEDVAAMQTPSSKAVAKEAGGGATPLPPQGTPIAEYEVRGFEMAKLLPDGSWQRVYVVNNREQDRLRILNDAKWFNQRGNGTYQARVLISCEMPRQPEPLVLEADEPADIPQEVVEAMINDVELEAEER